MIVRLADSGLWGIGAAAVMACPVGAQDEARPADDAAAPNDEPLVIDLMPPAEMPAPVIDLRCQDEVDAARITGEIIVCRYLDDTKGVWDQAGWERRYVEATPGAKAPRMEPALNPPNVGLSVTIVGCYIPSSAPPPLLYIDVEGSPEAPVGSDADRIASGLPPMEHNSIEDERRRRQAELGLLTPFEPGVPED